VCLCRRWQELVFSEDDVFTDVCLVVECQEASICDYTGGIRNILYTVQLCDIELQQTCKTRLDSVYYSNYLTAVRLTLRGDTEALTTVHPQESRVDI